MGRTLENKKAIVAELKETLSESQLAVVIDYKGLSVAQMTDLRGRLRETDAVCKVTKNTLMRIAVEGDENWEPMSEFLEGSSAFLFAKDDFGTAIKAYQAFQKDTKKTELRGGVLEGQKLSADDVKALTELPTKEELIARIAAAINSIPTKLAVGTNAVPKKLAVGIKEVPASLVRAVKAVSEKEQ
ncbi:50S ribosomal protein L10 [Geitlerinema sp. P-1104]|uniref:50S ribosomal protein L10 n=1 Tax=Geitlerinema sp. P-1104 TaxID=2546230 RepID=UPI001476A5E7|nr:50S ribosomal protein L10 [Geitlerinema sp. P-1104]NMG57806.1 50S ribosomal protein L10 [Geitlerinema sp. P-1104]